MEVLWTALVGALLGFHNLLMRTPAEDLVWNRQLSYFRAGQNAPSTDISVAEQR